jgi:hypothetical protein
MVGHMESDIVGHTPKRNRRAVLKIIRREPSRSNQDYFVSQ